MKNGIAGAALAAALSGPALSSPAAADTFVLVHGAFQTPLAWSAVAERLEARGHTVILVSLPGRDGDGRAPGSVTMDDHVAAVRAAVETASEPVVLVGHSFGGMVISATAEAIPDRIATLVYVAAFLPRSGQSMQDLASEDHHNGFLPDSFVIAPDYSHASLNPRDRAAIFAADAPADQATAIAAALVDEPLAPLATPVMLTPERFGRVRAAYVVTLRDRTVSPSLQMTMIGRGHVEEVVPVDAGHAAAQTAPDDLTAAIVAASTAEFE